MTPSFALQITSSVRSGAIAALRQRAARQAAKAQDGVAVTETGVVIRTGESAVASRLAEAFTAAADEIELEAW